MGEIFGKEAIGKNSSVKFSFLTTHMYYFDLQHFKKVNKYILRDHDRYMEGRVPGSVRAYKKGALSKEEAKERGSAWRLWGAIWGGWGLE